MLTPLLAATMANAANGTYTYGSMNTSPTNGTRMPLIAYVLWICHATKTATTVCQMSFWRARIPSPVRAFR
jgi:hypothetical protein